MMFDNIILFKNVYTKKTKQWQFYKFKTFVNIVIHVTYILVTDILKRGHIIFSYPDTI